MKTILSNMARTAWVLIVQNPKTSISGVLAWLAMLLAHFNIIFSQDLQGILLPFGLLIIGLAARDGNSPKIDR